MATITDSLKQLVDDLEIERHVTEAADAAEKAFFKALEKAGDYAHTHTGDLHQFLDKAQSTIDEKTEGKYADAWGKVREQIVKAWDKLAEQRPQETDIADVVDLTPRAIEDEDI